MHASGLSRFAAEGLASLRQVFASLALEGAGRADAVVIPAEDGGYCAIGLAAFYRPQNFIHSLYVTERGRGIGKALLDHVCAQADGPVSLKVQAKNLRAQAFYAREGFRCVERGEDAGVAWLRLVRG